MMAKLLESSIVNGNFSFKSSFLVQYAARKIKDFSYESYFISGIELSEKVQLKISDLRVKLVSVGLYRVESENINIQITNVVRPLASFLTPNKEKITWPDGQFRSSSTKQTKNFSSVPKNLNLQIFRLVCKTELVCNTGHEYD